MKSLVVTAALGAAMAGPAAAPASSEGGVRHPSNGGVAFGEVAPAKPKPKPKPKPRSSGRPVLKLFDVRPWRIYAYGDVPQVTFRIDGRDKQVNVRLVLFAGDSKTASGVVDLGSLATGVAHTIPVSALANPALPEGPLKVRLSARDSKRRLARPGAQASRVRDLELHSHRFPLAGPFNYGGDGARFGAGRPGHTHQGQDMIAAEGTPVVAPRGGIVKFVQYQASGAGYYVILDGDDEDRDYAFMHLREGSTVVKEQQHIATGERIGDVGSTGASSGAHLHFEIWEGGGWYGKGHPVDPLPYLQRWQSWSGVNAIG
jgi:murein DD-endopeptidase MepM/ murein hydrolase activator NlpD